MSTAHKEALSVEDTLKLALEALGFCQVSSEDGEVLTPKKVQKAIKAIKAALETHKALMSFQDGAQPSVSVEQDLLQDGRRLAKIFAEAEKIFDKVMYISWPKAIGEALKKYPKPQRTWAGLTDTEKYALSNDVAQRGVPVFEAICEAEAKLKAKNSL